MLTLAFFLLLVSSVYSSVTNLCTSSSPTFSVTQASGGCYVSTKNQVVFGESTGQISAVNLVAGALNHTSFTSLTLPVGQSLDLIRGDGIYGGNVRLDYINGVLSFRALGSSQFYYLGVLSSAAYTALDATGLQTYAPYYGQNNVIPQSTLQVGSAIALWLSNPSLSDNFDYAKIQILNINADGSLGLSTTSYKLQSKKSTVGTGFNLPVDVVLSADSQSYYISDYNGGSSGTGGVYQCPATWVGWTPSNCNLLFTPLHPQQLVVDKSANLLWVVEYTTTATGRVWTYDTFAGVAKIFYTGLNQASGIVGVGSPFTTIYVSEPGMVSSVDVKTGLKKFVMGFSSPKFLSYNPLSNRLSVPESTQLTDLDLFTNTAYWIANVASASKVININDNGQIVATGTNFIDLIQLTTAFNPNGPLLLGIGYVPISSIVNGLATVTGLQYPINVQDVPFGGTLNLLINHDAARVAGYTHYAIVFNGALLTNSFGDYRWDTNLNQFVYAATSPVNGVYYPVRGAELWLNKFFGGLVDTSSAISGSYTLYVYFYTLVGTSFNFVTYTYVTLQIDNLWPIASINQIYYLNNSVLTAVDSCAIVQGQSTLFTFDITASDPDNHLLSYGLSAVWGNNAGASIFSDSYTNNHIPSPDNGLWGGVTHTQVPLPPVTYWNASYAGDSSSTHCAHTFYLSVWDRAFNGMSYIHHVGYTQSLSFLLG